MANRSITIVEDSVLSSLANRLTQQRLSYDFSTGAESAFRQTLGATISIVRTGQKDCRVTIHLSEEFNFDEETCTLGVKLSSHHPVQRMKFDSNAKAFVCQGHLTTSMVGALSFVATDTKKKHKTERENSRILRRREGLRDGLYVT